MPGPERCRPVLQCSLATRLPALGSSSCSRCSRDAHRRHPLQRRCLRLRLPQARPAGAGKACANNFHAACVSQAELEGESGGAEVALPVIERSCRAGSALACSTLAGWYESETFVTRDEQKERSISSLRWRQNDKPARRVTTTSATFRFPSRWLTPRRSAAPDTDGPAPRS